MRLWILGVQLGLGPQFAPHFDGGGGGRHSEIGMCLPFSLSDCNVEHTMLISSSS